jgi:hypothetical protein
MTTPNRVYQYTTSTGQGDITLDGAAVFPSFFTADDAAGLGRIDVSSTPVAIIEEGDDVEISRMTISSLSPFVFSRTVLASRISGVAGTTKMSLGGAATVQIALSGEDFDAKVAADLANTFTTKQTFSATVKLQQALEKLTITADNPAAGDNNFDVLTQAIQYFTTNCDTNWTTNIRGDGSNTLNSIMAVGESLTIGLLATNGATAYYMSALKIDGNAVTPKYLDGSAFSAGNASAIDAYLLTIIKTASATFVVLAQQVKWA